MSSAPSETEATQALREMFRAQASDVPAGPDLSGVTVRRARKVARRRAAIGGLAVTVAFALTVGGVGVWRQWATPETGQDQDIAGVAGGKVEFEADDRQAPVVTGTAPLTMDVVVGNRLYDSTSGNWRDLVGDVDPAGVVRTPKGWLVGGTSKLRLLRTDGSLLPLLDAVDGWTASADGAEVAYVRGETLQLAKLGRDGLQPTINDTIAPGWTPIGFLATAVLLTNADRSQYAVWWRDGTFDQAGFSQVYPSAQADSFAVMPGSVGRPCLVRVSVGSGRLESAGAAGCNEVLERGAERSVASPNGQNLATPFDGGLWIINLARSVSAAAANGAASPVWIASCASDADAVPVWQDDSTVITTFHGDLVACGVDGSQRTVELPRGVPSGGKVVSIKR